MRQRGDRDPSSIGPALPPDASEARAVVRKIVGRSGSSFRPGMRLLPAARRDAIYAVYAFCRSVDDIADADLPSAEKLRALETWKREIDHLFHGTPAHPIGIALLEPVEQFSLPQAEFMAVIEGMTWDARAPVRAPPLDALRRYCRLVAGAVGLLSIRIFGAHDEGASRFALALGEALQLTNILRDISEDAQRGRLYLPAELLDRHGIDAREPRTVLDDRRFPEACRALEILARERFEEARGALAGCRRTALRPALVMMAVYLCLLDRLAKRGWHAIDDAVAPSRPAMLLAAARGALLGPLWPRSI